MKSIKDSDEKVIFYPGGTNDAEARLRTHMCRMLAFLNDPTKYDNEKLTHDIIFISAIAKNVFFITIWDCQGANLN